MVKVGALNDTEKARRIADLAFGEADFGTVVDAIHDAILAERKRCAEVAKKEGEGYRDHNLPQAAMGAFQAAKAIEAGA